MSTTISSLSSQELIDMIDTYSPSQIREAMISYVSNRKKNDKYALAYLIGMIQTQYSYICGSTWHREDLLRRLIIHIESSEMAVYRLIKSDYTRSEILSILNK